MRFLALSVFFVIVFGFLLLCEVDIPYLPWIGMLPGDLILRREGVIIYLPLASSVLVSIPLSFFLRRVL